MFLLYHYYRVGGSLRVGFSFSHGDLMGNNFRVYSPLESIEYGVYGDLNIIYPKTYSIYLRGTIGLRVYGPTTSY